MGVMVGVKVGVLVGAVLVYDGVAVGPVGVNDAVIDGCTVNVGVIDGPTVFVKVKVGVIVEVAGVEVEVIVGTPRTVTEPNVHVAVIDAPFWSDRSSPVAAAAVGLNATVDVPAALALNVILSSVPLPVTGLRFNCAMA